MAMAGTPITDPIAKSVSRFLMHGLRLPRIAPLTFDAMQPFYVNIGQQIDVPDALLTGTGYRYQLALSASPLPGWVTFNSGGDDAAAYLYSAADLAELAVFNARLYARVGDGCSRCR